MSRRGGLPQYESVPAHDVDHEPRLQPRKHSTYRSAEYKLADDSLRLPVPWASIALALFLTAFGVLCFVLAWMHFTQRMFGKERAEVAFMLLGALTFIPGSYHTCIAFCAWRGVPGFSWDSIPRY